MVLSTTVFCVNQAEKYDLLLASDYIIIDPHKRRALYNGVFVTKLFGNRDPTPFSDGVF